MRAAVLLAIALVPASLGAQGKERWATSPRVSPDGATIAFISERDGNSELYIMNADGSTPRRLTRTSRDEVSPNWSPDGKSIVYYVPGEHAIYIVSAAGGEPRLIDRAEGNQTPAFSRDGRSIIFASGKFPNIELYSIGTDGSNRRRIEQPGGFSYDVAPHPRVDGLAFVHGGYIVLMQSGSGHVRQMAGGAPRGQERPVWSPDGRSIAFQVSSREGADIWVVSETAGGQITRHAAGSHDEQPSWFPDGRRIAFSSDRDGRWRIYVMNADGSEQRVLH